ncbi:MAG: DNA polymerase II [Candidatus Latescibacterota bacterium]
MEQTSTSTESQDASATGLRGFLLHAFHREERGQTVVYAVGRLETGETFGLVDRRLPPCLYVRAGDRGRLRLGPAGVPVDLQTCGLTTMDGEEVLRLVCRTQPDLWRLAGALREAGVRTYEADLSHAHRFLVERGVRGSARIRGPWQAGRGVDRVYVDPDLEPCAWAPDLAVLVLDIETRGEASEVLAVSLVGSGPAEKHRVEEVHVLGEPFPSADLQVWTYAREADLLQAVGERVRLVDPDVLTGWNLVDFDLAVLQERHAACGLPFNLGRTRDDSWYREGEGWGRSRMVVYGRQVLDALHLVRASLQRFEDLRLDTVARAVLGRGKTLDPEEAGSMPEAILRAYTEDRRRFCRYCLEDARLVRDILGREGLLELTVQRSLLTGLPLERAWGSIAAFDLLYISQLRRRRIVAPSVGVDQDFRGRSPGGLVLPPRAGLYRHVFVFDFRSLYPSLIRTFNIDPLALLQADADGRDCIQAPNGARFSRTPGILPQILEQFFVSRAQARARGDAVASQAYKIVMNSFYGVLATSACRFANDQAAGAIIDFGHWALRLARELVEQEGARVIYGDTDSLFVDSGMEAGVPLAEAWTWGEDLCRRLNVGLAAQVREQYDAEPRLELEFQKYYVRFLLPRVRGSERGRAKGYAGLRVDRAGEHLDIVGMEAVRRDWTRLAHDLQRELLELLFHDAPPPQLEGRVREWVRAVRAGEKDRDLVYHKGLRKPVAAYTHATPPHVQAARHLVRPPGVVRYVVTRDGPQPADHVCAPIDYEHYVSKQIEPLVRTVAQVCPVGLEAALGGTADLFDGAR